MANTQSAMIHYCGECQMPIEYCCYGEKRQQCLEWLERNLPEVYAAIPAAERLLLRQAYREPIVVVPEMFSACVRDGRFASIGSIDDLKKYVVSPK